MTLDQATPAANQIKDLLAPYCERIEIAGSIRRYMNLPEDESEHPNDIDLVVLPKPGMELQLRQRIAQKTKPIQSGHVNLSVLLDWRPSQAHREGVRLDLYFAHAGTGDMFTSEPSNWGSVLLCRTGSREHNVYLCKVAQGRGLKWEVMRGLVPQDGPDKGKVIASETEEQIFKALGMEWIEPNKRERV